MSALLWLVAFVACLQSGTALEYGPGTMQRVYNVRVEQGLVRAGWQGSMAAAIECSEIGRIDYASFYNPRAGEWSYYRPVLITDCSQYRDRAMHYARNILLEVDWNTAVQNGFSAFGHTRVRVIRSQNRWRP